MKTVGSGSISGDDIYNEDFYNDNISYTEQSPSIILGILSNIIEINSFCDVGGGTGLWTREFIKLKNNDVDLDHICCIDGNYITEKQLLIPKKCFLSFDLEKRITLNEKYDLVVSLEVAEHLNSDRSYSFVEDLVNLGDTILFSAAVPGQDGDGHINEQHMTYWVDKFKQHGYEPFDVIRPAIQDNENIPFWYKQNIIVFAKKGTYNYKTLSKVNNKALTHVVVDELYDRVLFYKKSFEDEKNHLYSVIEKIDGDNENLSSRIDQLNRDNEELTNELNRIKSKFLYRCSLWVKRNIMRK